MKNADTIAAIATPQGQGGIGVIRISGPESLKILQKLCKISKKPRSHNAYQVWISAKNVSRETFLEDQAVYIYFKSPKSYTGEDVVEVSCHGGSAVLRAVLDETIRLGARIAARGEFTKRAFLNGKIDLAQAEAVLGLIKAENRVFAEKSAFQLRGHLSKKINALYNEVLELVARLEANVDFPEDINLPSKNRLIRRIRAMVGQIDKYLSTADFGRIMGQGAKAVIIGAPNVGKSTLMNSLLGEERAIVTRLPGTTRDVIEEQVDLGDVILRLSDTAGLRRARCMIEQEGIHRTKHAADQAELILFVIDASKQLSRNEKGLISRMSGKKVILVLNKIDLGKKGVPAARELKLPYVETSLIKGRGLDQLKVLTKRALLGNKALLDSDAVILNSRHKECLLRAKENLLRSLKSIKIGMPNDFVIIDLREAAQAVGEVTGKAVTERVLDKIFNEFCVGK